MATIATLSVLLEAKGQRQLLGDLGKVAGAITGVVVATGKMAERGGQVINVQNAFTRATGRQADALDRLRMATNGLVSDYDLMEQANLSLALGSSTSVAEFQKLAETAQVLGRALGLDVAFALNSLNIGIARQSRLVLDNVGLIVDAEGANRRYAESIGVAASALSDAQRQEAFRIEAMRQAEALVERLGGVTLNTGDAFRQLVVEIKNTNDAIATGTANSSKLAILFGDMRALLLLLRGDMKGAAEVFREWEEATTAYWRSVARTDEGVTALSSTLSTSAEQMRGFLAEAAAFGDTLQPVRDFNEQMELLEVKLQAIGTVATPAIFSVTGGLSDLGDVAHLTANEFIPDLTEQIKATNLEFNFLLTTLENVRNAQEEVNAAMDGFGKAQKGLGILGGLGRFLGVSIPFLGNVGGLISAGSSFAGFFAEGGTIPAGQVGVVGERGPEIVRGPATVTPSNGGMSLTVNVSGPSNPIAAARDREWLRALAESASELKANGFMFA